MCRSDAADRAMERESRPGDGRQDKEARHVRARKPMSAHGFVRHAAASLSCPRNGKPLQYLAISRASYAQARLITTGRMHGRA